jgi:hypothetical protein
VKPAIAGKDTYNPEQIGAPDEAENHQVAFRNFGSNAGCSGHWEKVEELNIVVSKICVLHASVLSLRSSEEGARLGF